MAWTRYQIFLALLMIVTGSINTLTTKWADEMDSKDSEGVTRKFVHPFVQACCMFAGEMLCLLVFFITLHMLRKRQDGSEDVHALTKGNRTFNRFVLMAPAMCDMTGTSIMYIGLTMTYASSFQMFRGSVIIFTGILSIIFLQKKLLKREWLGMALVIIGLVLVGLADFLGSSDSSKDTNSIITGDILIIIAQVITASQMVIEEKFVNGMEIPALQAVGLEGCFGFTVLALLCIPFYFIPVDPPFSDNPRNVLEDAIEAFILIKNNYLIGIALLGTILSIAFFNFAGISVTKEQSATTRMVLDSVRTIVIWVFSLAFFGQEFHWLQLVGFIFLLTGMCLYNGITFTTCFTPIKAAISRWRYRNMPEDSVINNTVDRVEGGE